MRGLMAPGREPKRPNTVPPEPDMRARMQPSIAPRLGNEVADGRDQRDGRRLQIVARFGEPEAELCGPRQRRGQRRQRLIVRRSSRRKTSAVTTGTSGLTSTIWSAGKSRSGATISPTPRTSQGAREAGGNIGPQRQRQRRELGHGMSASPERRHQAQSRGGIGGAAAKPGGDRQVLVQLDGEAVRHVVRPAGAERGDGARNEIGIARLPAPRRRAGHGETVASARRAPRVRRRRRRRRRGFRAHDSRRRGGR